MHPRHGASPGSSSHRRGRSGQRRWLSMAVARMLSELFPCSPAPREVSRNTPDTGLRGPSAPPWPRGSVALCSLKPALLPLFGTYSKKNTYFLYFARYFHSQPILTSPLFSGVLHPWPPHTQLPQGPHFSICLQCDTGHSHGSQDHAVHIPLQSAALFFIQL